MHDHSDHDHSDNSFDGFTIDEIKKNFGALAQELEHEEQPSVGKVLENAEEVDQEPIDLSPPPFYRGYVPTIKDYLARATTDDDCREIIEYCLKKGEISQEEADRFLDRLDKGGPRAFGTRRPGHYDQKL